MARNYTNIKNIWLILGTFFAFHNNAFSIGLNNNTCPTDLDPVSAWFAGKEAPLDLGPYSHDGSPIKIPGFKPLTPVIEPMTRRLGKYEAKDRKIGEAKIEDEGSPDGYTGGREISGFNIALSREEAIVCLHLAFHGKESFLVLAEGSIPENLYRLPFPIKGYEWIFVRSYLGNTDPPMVEMRFYVFKLNATKTKEEIKKDFAEQQNSYRKEFASAQVL